MTVAIPSRFSSESFRPSLYSTASDQELWPDRHNKCGSPLSRIEGQILVDIINDHGFDQLVHFPTRERNTLDLIITSLPNQFVDIHGSTFTPQIVSVIMILFLER